MALEDEVPLESLLNSTDDATTGAQVGAATATDLAPQPTEQQGDTPPVKLSLDMGLKQDRGQAVKVNDLSAKTGLPAGLVSADPQGIGHRLTVEQALAALKDAPTTSDFLQDPHHVSLVGDDVAALAQLERLVGSVPKAEDGPVSRFTKQTLSALSGAFDFLPPVKFGIDSLARPTMGGLLQGASSAAAAYTTGLEAAYRASRREGTPAQPAPLDLNLLLTPDQQKQLRVTLPPTNLARANLDLSQQVPPDAVEQKLRDIHQRLTANTNALASAISGYDVTDAEEGSFAQHVMSGIGQMGLVLAAAPVGGVPAVGGLLFGQGVEAQRQRQEAAGTYGSSAGTDVGLALGGAASAAINLVPIMRMLEAVPAEVRNSFVRRGVDLTLNGLYNAGAEVADSATQMLIAGTLGGNPEERLGMTAQQAAEAFTVAMMVRGAVQAAYPHIEGAHVDERNAYKDAANARTVEDLVRLAKGTKLRQDAPNKWNELLDALGARNEEDASRTVWIDGAETAEALSRMDPSDVQADPLLRMLGERLSSRGSQAEDVPVTLGDFITAAADSSHFDTIKDGVSLGVGGISRARQATQKAFLSDMDLVDAVTRLSQRDAEVARRVQQARELSQDTRDKIVAAGVYSPAEAEHMANVVASYYTAKSLSEGKSVPQVFAENPFSIEQDDGRTGGLTQGSKYAPLKGAPTPRDFHGPIGPVVDVADSYAEKMGMPVRRQAVFAKVDPEFAAKIAKAYDEMVDDPNDPAVKASYAALKRETLAQYQALVDAGYHFHFIDAHSAEGKAYGSSPWNAIRDLRDNKRMGVFPTNEGFGTLSEAKGNPLLEDTGLTWEVGSSGKTAPVTYNDVFRAVHDAFGHGLEGAGFRADGEENAWQAHARLYSKDALPAMTTETRGQNSWLNYGPYGERNRTANTADTVFADQKTGLLPSWAWETNVVPDTTEGVDRDVVPQLAQEDVGAPDIPTFAGKKQQPDAVSVRGVHFSGEARTELDPSWYGTGAPDAARRRVDGALYGRTDGRTGLSRRTYFYVSDVPTGEVVKEHLVPGSVRHEVQLSNMYDLREDPRGFAEKHQLNASDMEAAISRAGFDGYIGGRLGEGTRGAVVFGHKKGTKIPVARVPSAEEKRLLQRNRVVRGYLDVETRTIRLTHARDLTTFLHEFGHVMKAIEDSGDTLLSRQIRRWQYGRAGDIAEEANAILTETPRQLEQSVYRGSQTSEMWPGVNYTTDAGVADLFAESEGRTSSHHELKDNAPLIQEEKSFGEQPDAVKAALTSMGHAVPDEAPVALALARVLSAHEGDWGAAAQALAKAGIYGIDAESPIAGRSITIWDGRAAADRAAFRDALREQKGRTMPESPTEDASSAQGAISSDDVKGYLLGGTTGDAAKDAAIYHATHETFARAWEDFLRQGVAPSAGLRAAFRKFAGWFTQVYRGNEAYFNAAQRRGGARLLDSDIQRVMQRLLASEDQIAQEMQSARYAPLVDSAAADDAPSSAEVKERETEQHDIAMERVRAAVFRAIKRKFTKQWHEELGHVIEEQMQLLLGPPEPNQVPSVHQVRFALREGLRLSADEVRERVGEDQKTKSGKATKRIPRKLNGMTDKNGMPLDEAAQMLGLDSADTLMDMLMNGPTLAEDARARADAEMLRRHGDPLNDGTIDELTSVALDNAANAKRLVAEINALGEKQKGESPSAGIRQQAKQTIAALSYRALRPWKYRRAEVNAAVAAQKALDAGDREGARQAKLEQLANHHLFMEAQAAQEEFKKSLKWLARFRKKAVMDAIKKAGGGFWDQVASLLGQYELRQNAPAPEVPLAEWAARRGADFGDELTVAPFLSDTQQKTSWKDLTSVEMSGLVDTLKNIEHVARETTRMTRDGEKIAHESYVEQWLAAHKDIAPSARAPTISDEGRHGGHVGRNLLASLTKTGFLASWIDGGSRTGMTTEVLYTNFVHAHKRYMTLLRLSAEPVVEMFNERTLADKKWQRTKHMVHSLGERLSGDQLIAIMLHMGSESGRRKVMMGEGWATDETQVSMDNPVVKEVMSLLRKQDMDLVQSIWTQMGTLYPELAEQYAKASGRTMGKVEAAEVETPWGTYPGGYFPIRPSRVRVDAAGRAMPTDESSDRMFRPLHNIMDVDPNATKTRTLRNYLVSFDLSEIPKYFQEVTRYIAYRDAVREANRFLSDPRIRQQAERIVGTEEFAEAKSWLRDVARMGHGEANMRGLNTVLKHLRTGTTLAILGLRLGTGIAQVEGLSNTVAEVGAKYVADAIAYLGKDTKSIAERYKWASEQSSVLPYRLASYDREIYHTFNQLMGKHRWPAVAQKAGLEFLGLIQLYTVDVPSWYAAYNKEMDASGDHDKAVAYGDWVVENIQGSGRMENLARAFRQDNELWRNATMFMTYYSSQWNAQRDAVRGSRQGYYSPASMAARLLFISVLPAILYSAGRGELWEDDDSTEDNVSRLLLSIMSNFVGGLPLVRDAAYHLTSGSYQPSFLPAIQMLTKGVDSTGNIVKDLWEGNEVSEADARAAIMLASELLHIPGASQFWATSSHLHDVLIQGDDLTAHGLIYGPEK